MSFDVGQQVVCVNDKFSQEPEWRELVRTFPQLNAIYTIREIHEGYGSQSDLIGFCFYEIVNPLASFYRHTGSVELEPAFNSRNFRPVKPTNIAVFHKLLASRDLPELVCAAA